MKVLAACLVMLVGAAIAGAATHNIDLLTVGGAGGALCGLFYFFAILAR
jgi:hypothetical protein